MLDYYNLIEEYIEGTLSGSDLVAFEKELNNNPLLFREVEKRKEILNALDSLRLKKKVKAAINKSSSRPIGILSIGKWWIIAASLIISTIAIWLWKEDSTYTDVAEHQMNESDNNKTADFQDSTVTFINKPDSSKLSNSADDAELWAYAEIAKSNILIPQDYLVRSVDPSEDTSNMGELDLALKSLRGHEYAKAMVHLSKVPKSDITESFIFIKAYCLFQTGKYSAASDEYYRLRDDLQFAYEAQWNYLVCQLALKNFKYVDLQLEKMARDNYFPYRSKAIKLKESLKKTSG